MAEPIEETIAAAAPVAKLKTPVELPKDPFEYGEKLNAAYKKGWADAKEMFFEMLASQKTATAPVKKGFLD